HAAPVARGRQRLDVDRPADRRRDLEHANAELPLDARAGPVGADEDRIRGVLRAAAGRRARVEPAEEEHLAALRAGLLVVRLAVKCGERIGHAVTPRLPVLRPASRAKPTAMSSAAPLKTWLTHDGVPSRV